MKRNWLVGAIVFLVVALTLVLRFTVFRDKDTTTTTTTTTETTEENKTEERVTNVVQIDAAKVDAIYEDLIRAAEELVVDETSVHIPQGEKELVLPKGPKRVAVLNASLVTLYEQAGGYTSILVGGERASRNSIEQLGEDITKRPGTTMISETYAAKNWDMEQLLAAQPDLIIVSSSMSAYDTVKAPMESAGIPVLLVEYEGIKDYVYWTRVFAELNGKPEIYEEAKQVAKDVAEVLAAVPEKGPRVLSLYVGTKTVRANLNASENGTLLDQLHAENVAQPFSEKGGQKWVEISAEDILKANPDMILVPIFDDSIELVKTGLNAKYGDDPVWQEVPAVKEDRITYLQHDLFVVRPGKRYAEAYRKLATILYPEQEFPWQN